MKMLKHSTKIVIAFGLLLGWQVAIASLSFTGITDEKAKAARFSLKNMHRLSAKGLSYSSLKYSLQFKGIQSLQYANTSGNGSEVTSLLKYNSGNTSYVYPYKFTVKVPKFKTPAPPAASNR